MGKCPRVTGQSFKAHGAIPWVLISATCLIWRMTERPPIFQERKDLANAYIPVEQMSQDGYMPLPRRRQASLPYCFGFPFELAVYLRKCSQSEVVAKMEQWFPDCDAVDCHYLAKVIEEIQLQKIWATDRPFNQTYPDSGKHFTTNATEVKRWLRTKTLRLEREVALSNNENHIEARLPLDAPASFLAELLYLLDKDGKISLRDLRAKKREMAALCRTLCRVFPPQKSTSKNPAKALYTSLTKIKDSELGPGKTSGFVLEALGRQKSTFETAMNLSKD